MEPLGRLIRHARSSALGRYERWLESRFERRLGIDTSGIDHDLARLGVAEADLAHAHAYQAMQVSVFRRIMRAAPIEPTEHVMVDLGSGKGRAVFLGAECGFRRVVGVELAPRLHEAALRNVRAYRRCRPLAPPIELYCANAAEWPLPEEPLFLFLYNPFAEPVVEQIARRLDLSLRCRPRDVVVAYRNPVHRAAFDAVSSLTRLAANSSFTLYRSSLRASAA